VTGYAVNYDLHGKTGLDGCVGSVVKGCPSGTPVLTDYDHGWLGVFEDNKRTMVITHKDVHFNNQTVNGILQALWTDAEAGRELAEVACCLKSVK
jgi:hypothetical protein